jgi:transposase
MERAYRKTLHTQRIQLIEQRPIQYNQNIMSQPNHNVPQMCKDYEMGESCSSIAHRFSLSPQTVQYHIRKAGIKMRGERKPPAQVDPAELKNIVDDAILGIEETARHFGVSVPTITRRMRRLGLKSKKGHGSPMEKNYFWKGGRKLDDDGYVLVKSPGHPFADAGGYVREHRLVMEEKLGRFLAPHEVVHHKKPQDKQNNDPDNLELFQSNADHLRHELTGKTPNYTPEGIQRMRENAQRVNHRRWLATHQELENDDGPLL